MIIEENQGGELSAEEQAYFETGGESAIPVEEEKPSEAQAEQPQAEEGQPPEDVPRDEKGKFVPHQALHAEREEHKRTKSELAEIRQKQAVLEDRWNTLLSLKQQQEAPKEEGPPDPNEDIFAYAKWQGEQLAALQQKISGQEQQVQQQQAMQQAEAQLWNEWSRDAQEYATQTPDFGDAVTYLSQMRDQQLKALSIANPDFSTEQGRVAQINAELKQIVLSAKQQRMSAAQAVYEIAKGYGYTRRASDPVLPEKLQGVAQAQESARTIGQSPGRATGDAMTPETIAAMPADEFNRWAADPKNARLLEKFLGA